MIASKQYWLEQSWGKLRLVDTPDLPENWGNGARRFSFLCDCGRISDRVFYSVINGSSTSCGKCDWKSKEWWISQRWGDLRLDPKQELPDEWGSGHHGRFRFLCDCGKVCARPVGGLMDASNCTRCTWKPKSYWLTQRWGSLTVDPNQSLPSEWAPSSNKKFKFLCACGRQKKATACYAVTAGEATSCGSCTYKSKEYWLDQKWGRLRLDLNQDLPAEWGQGSPDSFILICDCGNTCPALFYNLTNGSTQTCRVCDWKPKEFWLEQRWGKLRLDPDQGLPDEWGTGNENRWGFICDCKGVKSVHPWLSVVGGNTSSCGCLAPGKSSFSPAGKLFAFLKPLAPDALSSYWFKNETGSRREYDIYVPSKKLAIEYHGLYYHSEERKGKGDYDKYVSSRHRGDRLIQIYGDEWRTKPGVFREMIKDLLAPGPKLRIKPVFTVETKTSPEARAFLDAHHYLGAASGCVTIVARYREAIVGVWVFMKRETGVILWHRACWDRKYKTWNPHEKALKLALPALRELGFIRMVTFSDNRFHTGNLYEKLGFTFEEELKPDYCYSNGVVRKSKYALRVKAGTNETAEAVRKGWYRIWDSGKRRYSLAL